MVLLWVIFPFQTPKCWNLSTNPRKNIVALKIISLKDRFELIVLLFEVLEMVVPRQNWDVDVAHVTRHFDLSVQVRVQVAENSVKKNQNLKISIYSDFFSINKNWKSSLLCFSNLEKLVKLQIIP